MTGAAVEILRIGPQSLREQPELVEELRRLTGSLPKRNGFNFEKYVRENSVFELFVKMVEGKPRYTLGIARWEKMPYFSLYDLRSLEPSTGPFLHRGELNSLFRSCFQVLHSENRFTYFYATRSRTYTRKYLEGARELSPIRGLDIFDEYDFTLEGIVRTNDVPAFEYQRNLLGYEDRRFDYWIKRGTLKVEHLAAYLPVFGTEPS